MKPAQYKPTAQELIEKLGAMPGGQNKVGLIVNNRVIWVDPRDVLLAEETLSVNLIRAHIRRTDPKEAAPLPKINAPVEFTSEPPEFIKKYEDDVEKAQAAVTIPSDIASTDDPNVVCEFDMGRATEPEIRTKKLLGGKDEDLPDPNAMPGWLGQSKGLASGHPHLTDVEEGWL
jgi:hypothetical protein